MCAHIAHEPECLLRVRYLTILDCICIPRILASQMHKLNGVTQIYRMIFIVHVDNNLLHLPNASNQMYVFVRVLYVLIWKKKLSPTSKANRYRRRDMYLWQNAMKNETFETPKSLITDELCACIWASLSNCISRRTYGAS